MLQLRDSVDNSVIAKLQAEADWAYTVDGLPVKWDVNNRNLVEKLACLHHGLVSLQPFADKVRLGLETYGVSGHLSGIL